ncbi:cupin domain-containing protein [Ancylobacter sp. Lp-2]|uniref:cupin domain-containing protein n=1 Tax=Ancylobacter sp. Lp-2 TaxID=2881339 RepID=UPI001E47F94C|nr:cupin domain-containing protein [Ancylobacter sp. Lp-2]MCB4771111.1 cupin domain-containing protein [Ancylobacter sp. Lp-2]
MTADEVIALLDLTPGATCGFVRLTYVASQRIAPDGLPAPFEGGRPMGSALYFLVTPAAPVQLHRIRNDQLYHYYLGDPLEVLLLHEDGGVERAVVGPDLAAGQCVQLFIPGGTFHTARLVTGGGWFLGASTEWPGVEPEDVELGDREALVARFPSAAVEISDFPVPLAASGASVALSGAGARFT